MTLKASSTEAVTERSHKHIKCYMHHMCYRQHVLIQCYIGSLKHSPPGPLQLRPATFADFMNLLIDRRLLAFFYTCY